MKKIFFLLWLLAFLGFNLAIGQNVVVTKPLDKKDTKIIAPEAFAEYSIASYKNVDYLKLNPNLFENAGLHSDVYISNTQHGVIIISSSESNDALKDFREILETNPGFYERSSRQDTLVFLPESNQRVMDFTKASSITNTYTNAFNHTPDVRTGISWSKGTHTDFISKDAFGKVVYDLIIVISKPAK